jgi:L-galactose dehydrogenase
MSLTSYQAAPPCNKGKKNVGWVVFSVNGFLSNQRNTFGKGPERGWPGILFPKIRRHLHQTRVLFVGTHSKMPSRRTMHYRQLGRTGLNVSVLSFGASSLGGVFRAVDPTAAIRTVHVALDLGMNFIDVSPYYGATKAETMLGRALRDIPRERYFLATKVGQYSDGEFDFSEKRVTRSLDESCARLGVDYIDLLQCHDIEFADLNQIVNETLPAMVKLRTAGRIGHIGITGLPLKIFLSIIDRAPPGVVETILSFCRYELNDTALDSLLPYLAQKQVGVINASPTGMGLLTERGAPAWHPASKAIIAGTRLAVDYCKSIGADIVKVAVQFCVAHPGIATTLIGSANPENIRKNIRYAEEPVDFELMARILAILRPIKNHNFTRGRPENRDAIIG